MSSLSAVIILKDNNFSNSLKKATKCLEEFKNSTEQCKKELTTFDKSASKTLSALVSKTSRLNINNFTKDIAKATKQSRTSSKAQDGDIKQPSKKPGFLNMISGGYQKAKNLGISAIDSIRSGISLITELEDKLGVAGKNNSFTNTMNNLKETYNSTLLQIMGVSKDGSLNVGSAFDSVKNIIIRITDLLTKWSSDGTIDTISQTFSAGMSLIATGIGWVIDNINWLIPIVGGLAASLTALNVINTVKGLMDMWKTSTFATTLATHGLNAALRANPLGLIITGIGLAVTLGTALYQNWETLSEGASNLWRNISNSFKTGVNTAIDWLNELIDKTNILLQHVGIEIPKIEKLQLDPAPPEVNAYRLLKGDTLPSNATGINRVPQNMVSLIHKDEAIIPAQYNPYNPNAKSAKGGNNVTININGYNRSSREIVNDLMPQLKLAMANM